MTGRLRQSLLTGMRNRIESSDFAAVSFELGVPVSVVRSVVYSFFDSVSKKASSLPFSTATKIYDRKAFDKHCFVCNIPYIGRIGPVYSRYLQWRSNEAKSIERKPRCAVSNGITPVDIEKLAESIIDGIELPEVKRTTVSEQYDRVWIVGDSGKRLARQVIIKEK